MALRCAPLMNTFQADNPAPKRCTRTTAVLLWSSAPAAPVNAMMRGVFFGLAHGVPKRGLLHRLVRDLVFVRFAL